MTATIDVPNEVYLIALDLMEQTRPADPADARKVLRSAEERCSYHQHKLRFPLTYDLEPVTAFGAALAMYVSLSGPFAEDGGEFGGVNGWKETAA